jgi:spore coat polysaccharide biosynthesis protein SpsF
MSEVGAIVLCRLDSQRLPGKALREVGGRPLVDYALARCRQVAELAGNIVLATSEREVDDPLADFARSSGISVFRGSTDDVAGRVVACSRQFGFRYFLRVNGDSPFLEPALVGEALRQVQGEPLDLVTNLLPRSFPYGVSVEVVRAEAYAGAYRRMSSREQREHVTSYLYENIGQFRHSNIACPLGDFHRVRMTVDTPEDLAWFGRLVQQFGSEIDRASYADVLRVMTPGAEVS